MRRTVGLTLFFCIQIFFLRDPSFGEEPGPLEPELQSALEKEIAEIHIEGPAEIFPDESTFLPQPAKEIDQQSIESSPALAIDDVLRMRPEFQLFRRSNSVVSHPTAQGVNLRGVGGSGASRALVLLDELPLNDPFGGWVNWCRVPPLFIQQLQVRPGWGPLRWGGTGLSGQVAMVSKDPSKTSAEAAVEFGSQDTGSVQSILNYATERGRILVGGDALHTEGYKLISPEQRGAIDVAAGSRHNQAFTKGTMLTGSASDLTLAASYFDEDRDNGTRLTGNGSRARTVSARYRSKPSDSLELDGTAFFSSYDFNSMFSSQSADRHSETPALDQFDVPAKSLGFGLGLTHGVSQDTALTLGGDLRSMTGETNERFAFIDGDFRKLRNAGADQLISGLYGATSTRFGDDWRITAALRMNGFSTYNVSRDERNISDYTLLLRRDRSDSFRFELEPKVGAQYRLSNNSSLYAAAYQNVRLPTINELVRPFRVRNDVTEANESLRPERLYGFEAGGKLYNRTFNAEVTGFINIIDNPVLSVTLGSGPGEIPPCGVLPEGGLCRQRQNVGQAIVEGFAVDFGWKAANILSFNLAYLLTDSEVTDASDASQLEGNRLAQVPVHQASARVQVVPQEDVSTVLEVSTVGEQFEDDRNSLTLGRYATVNLSIQDNVAEHVVLFVKAENLFNKRYEVQVTSDGVETLGTPLFIHAGAQVKF